MRRTLAGLAVAALTVLFLPGAASAAGAQVTHFNVRGTFADAFWSTSTDTSATETFVNVARPGHAPELGVDQVTINRDENGNVTGGTETSAKVTSGFSFTIDAARLTSASLSGPGLPATTCTLDAALNPISCRTISIDVAANWTGQGPLSRSVLNEHFKSGGYSLITHGNGTFRDARATGTVARLTLSASQFADLGNTHSGSTTICVGSSC